MRKERSWFAFGIILTVALMIGYPLFSIEAQVRGMRRGGGAVRSRGGFSGGSFRAGGAGSHGGQGSFAGGRGAAGGFNGQGAAAGGRYAGGAGQRSSAGVRRDTDVSGRAGTFNKANVNTANVNRTNVNTGNINVNRSATVNAYGGYGHRYGYGWGAAAAGLAVGASVAALSGAAQPVVVNNQTYYADGGTYYRPCYEGSEVAYCVVPNPNH